MTHDMSYETSSSSTHMKVSGSTTFAPPHFGSADPWHHEGDEGVDYDEDQDWDEEGGQGDWGDEDYEDEEYPEEHAHGHSQAHGHGQGDEDYGEDGDGEGEWGDEDYDPEEDGEGYDQGEHGEHGQEGAHDQHAGHDPEEDEGQHGEYDPEEDDGGQHGQHDPQDYGEDEHDPSQQHPDDGQDENDPEGEDAQHGGASGGAGAHPDDHQGAGQDEHDPEGEEGDHDGAGGAGAHPDDQEGAGTDPSQHPDSQADNSGGTGAKAAPPKGDAPEGTLNIALVNNSKEEVVYAVVTGKTMDGKTFILKEDGKTPYPVTAAGDIPKDCVIEMKGQGETTDIYIPKMQGGRIFFSYGKPLTFKANEGGALAEPSVSASGDPSQELQWGFCEMTYNDSELYANISYVDFVGLPIGLECEDDSGKNQHVAGLSTDGIEEIAQGLKEQEEKEGVGWDKLIVQKKDGSGVLRILSPNMGTVMFPDIGLATYFDDEIKKVWEQWSQPVQVNTQSDKGTVTGQVKGKAFVAQGTSIDMPDTKAIWTCCSGAFADGDPTKMVLIPRLGAAFHRGTALEVKEMPEPQDLYYKGEAKMNHYSRLTHEAHSDNKGYTFPYDDVQPDGGEDQSGKVQSSSPKRLIVSVGGLGVKGGSGGEDGDDHEGGSGGEDGDDHEGGDYDYSYEHDESQEHESYHAEAHQGGQDEGEGQDQHDQHDQHTQQ